MEWTLIQMDENLLKELLVFAAVFFIVSSILLIVRKVALKAAHRWVEKTDTEVDDIIVKSLRYPSLYLVFAVGLYVALGTSDFPPGYVNYGLKALYIIIILSATLAAAALASRIIQFAIERSSISVPVTGMSRAIVNVTILALGLLVILHGLGVSITPLLTALGVGGLAVALALQDTLANLFAGIHILVEKPLRVDDYIKLDTGEEGYVDDIGWRTTRIRKLGNNIVVVPNSKLAQSTILNYSMPEKRMSLLIRVGVSYDSDPDKVERILIEETEKAAGEVKGLLAEPAPFVRFIPGFGDSSLDFTLICQVSEFVDQYLAQHELRKRIFKRFKQEGIEIPFPIRTVYMKQATDD
jgi:small-conductance mechanosensitive channel